MHNRHESVLLRIFFLMYISSMSVCSASVPQVPDSIEPYLKEEYLNAFIEQAEELAKKYTDSEYLDQLINADRIKYEKKQSFNNLLLYEIPFSRLINVHVPHVGIYTKDLLKLSFTSLDWAADWFLQHNLQAYFTQVIFNQLIRSDKTFALLQRLHNATEQEHATVVHALYDLVQHQLQIPYADLYSGALFPVISKHFVANRCTEAIRNHFLVRDSIANNPVAIFSLMEEHLLSNLILNSPQTTFLSMANDFFKKQGYLPAFTESGLVYYTQKIALAILFIGWFNQSVLIPQWTNYVINHHEELTLLLADYQSLKASRLKPRESNQASTNASAALSEKNSRIKIKEAEMALKTFINQGQQLSFTTWLKFKNMKQAEWEFYYNLIISLPGWYRVTQVAYNIGQQLVQETSLKQSLEQPLEPKKMQEIES